MHSNEAKANNLLKNEYFDRSVLIDRVIKYKHIFHINRHCQMVLALCGNSLFHVK